MKTQQKTRYHIVYSTGLVTMGFDMLSTACEMIDCTSDLATIRPVAMISGLFSVINGIPFSHN